MNTRRDILKKLTSGTILALVPVAGTAIPGFPRPVTEVTAPWLPRMFRGDLICLHDAKYAHNFCNKLSLKLDELKDQLPEDGGFEIVWHTVPDRDVNPFGDIGSFVAIEAPEREKGDHFVDWDSFNTAMTKMFGRDSSGEA